MTGDGDSVPPMVGQACPTCLPCSIIQKSWFEGTDNAVFGPQHHCDEPNNNFSTATAYSSQPDSLLALDNTLFTILRTAGDALCM